MNIILLEPTESLSDGFYQLNERKSNHISKILKASKGSFLEAAKINDSFGLIKIVSIEKYAIVEFFPQEKLQTKEISVNAFISYQRPQTLKKIFFLAGSLGLDDLFFFRAEKSEKSYESSKVWELEELNLNFYLGMEQSKKNKVPRVSHIHSKSILEKTLKNYQSFLLNSYSENSLSKVHSKNIAFVLGPESGFTEDENCFFKKNCSEEIRVSKSILRTEHAFTFFCSQLELIGGFT
jgi:16S rRNA (uracil1498-N3)-methyltransferase